MIARILSVLALAASSLALASCQDQRAFGMPLSEFKRILDGNDPAPILALDDRSLGDPGQYGPAGWYCLALWLDSRGADSTAGADSAAGTGSASGADSAVSADSAGGAAPTAGAGSAGGDAAPSGGAAPSAGGAAPSAGAAASKGGPKNPADTIARLLRLALAGGDNLVKERAALALLERMEAAGDYEELLALADDLDSTLGGTWKVRRARLAALDALGRGDQILDELKGVRIAFPDESAADADALDCMEAAARIRKGPSGGATRSLTAMRRIILERPASEWTARALAVASEAAAAGPDGAGRALSADEERVARMRIAARARDYGRAYKEAAASSVAALSASPAVLSDAGKAYLYSGSSKPGAARFAEIEMAATKSGAADLAWTALFYRGRFERALEHWSEAAALFSRAADSAGRAGVSASDVDASLWYGAECAGKAAQAAAAASIAKSMAKPGGAAALEAGRKARGIALDALISASKAWSDPADFSDLADELLREALRARDWDALERMSIELSPALSPTIGARADYVAARALELGLGASAGDAAASARDRFAAMARDGSAPLYYRVLASWRSGEDVSTAPERAEPEKAGAKSEPGALESLIGGLSDFGLGRLAASEARAAADGLEADVLRRIAARLADAGQHDGSIQVAAAIVAKKDYAPARDDYYLLYPRPYLKEIRGLSSDAGLSERLVLGLIRSESAFKADIRSRAGAVGLSQLMPATAADQAKALGMREYDLESPKDNLRIGIAYFSYLLKKTGSPLRAMMAYNAGPTRLSAWASDGEGLPDDLLAESITIAETRQYCRNILLAAAAYGELYEGVRPGATAGRIVEGE